MVEMTAPSADGRITHGCPGIWSDEQAADWRSYAVEARAFPADADRGHQLAVACLLESEENRERMIREFGLEFCMEVVW